jgi:hypothetical protein
MPTKPTGRPRGRPPGSKNKPKDVFAFIDECLKAPVVGVKAPKPKKRGGAGRFTYMTPEERSAHAKAMKAKVKDYSNVGRKKGVPQRSNCYGHALAEKEASPEVKRIMKKMKNAGQLPDDPRAVQALETTLKILKAQDTDAKTKVAAARLLLDFTKAKPAAKVAIEFSPEDFLDEIAAEEFGDEE